MSWLGVGTRSPRRCGVGGGGERGVQLRRGRAGGLNITRGNN